VPPSTTTVSSKSGPYERTSLEKSGISSTGKNAIGQGPAVALQSGSTAVSFPTISKRGNGNATPSPQRHAIHVSAMPCFLGTILIVAQGLSPLPSNFEIQPAGLWPDADGFADVLPSQALTNRPADFGGAALDHRQQLCQMGSDSHCNKRQLPGCISRLESAQQVHSHGELVSIGRPYQEPWDPTSNSSDWQRTTNLGSTLCSTLLKKRLRRFPSLA
jgi:hypothetical protein